MNKGNWDYAINMFDKATVLMPDNLMYRQTKRGCTRRKYDNNGSGARMSSVKLMGIRGRIKKSRMKKDWASLDRAAEEGLILNPWDVQLNSDLGEACKELGYADVALQAYRDAVEVDQNNIDLNRILGMMLRERGEYTEATKCFERIRKLDPTDGVARSMISQIQAESVMDRGGYDKAERTQDVKATNAYEADRQARKGKAKPDLEPGMSEEADLQRAVRKDPSNVNVYMKLADYYRGKKQHEESIATYQQALEVSGGDPNVREQLEDAQLDLMRENFGQVRNDAQSNSDDEDKKQLCKSMAEELLNREIEVLANRVERYPKDMRLKKELATRFMRVTRYQQAIPLLQQASSDARLKDGVFVALGECFLHEKKLDLARRQFEKALLTIDPQDQPDDFKTANYYLGRLYEKANKHDKAEHHYTEILGVDYEYKDVLKRLEGLGDGEE